MVCKPRMQWKCENCRWIKEWNYFTFGEANKSQASIFLDPTIAFSFSLYMWFALHIFPINSHEFTSNDVKQTSIFFYVLCERSRIYHYFVSEKKFPSENYEKCIHFCVSPGAAHGQEWLLRWRLHIAQPESGDKASPSVAKICQCYLTYLSANFCFPDMLRDVRNFLINISFRLLCVRLVTYQMKLSDQAHCLCMQAMEKVQRWRYSPGANWG